MPVYSRTSRTVRVTGIPGDTTEDSLLQRAQVFCDVSLNKTSFFGRRELDENLPPVVSLAPERNVRTGTVTLPSEKLKKKALNSPRTWPGTVDDDFIGLTTLHCVDEPDLDICAIHGLNGNAFDTWAWEQRDMWLRDFLPKPQPHRGLERLRVMTFGYSSLVRDNTNREGLHEWTTDLLRSVSAARSSIDERSRPIIFVCHSLGGVVGRQAMIRLQDTPNNYPGLSLEQCGLLFLSTPHIGTVAADWNGVLIEFAKLFQVKRGHEFTQLLSAFNNASTDARERFGLLRSVPPFKCLYETQAMTVLGRKRVIVTAASAGLLGQRADSMRGANHVTICKFPSATDQRYLQLLDCLDGIREQLVERQQQQLNELREGQRQQDQQDQDRQQLPSANNHQTQVQGGEARGGDATGGNVQNGNVRGGNATGGNARGDGDHVRVIGGNATGGNAMLNGVGGSTSRDSVGGSAIGGDAVGGDAVGGNARSG